MTANYADFPLVDDSVTFEVHTTSNCDNIATISINAITDVQHMTSDQALVIPFTMTTTPTECNAEVVSSIVVTPPSALFTVDSAARTVTIALTSTLSDAQVYSVAVMTKIDLIDKDSWTFSATIFDCTAMAID